MSRKIVSEIIALLYVCLMLYTAISKLRDYNLSREQMAMMPLMTPIAHVIAWLLPGAEIVIATLLFFPKTRVIGLKSVTGLMLFFSIYIVYMMSYYEHLPCSCGGLLDMLSWPAHLIFNSIFIILGIIALLLSKKRRQEVESKVLLEPYNTYQV